MNLVVGVLVMLDRRIHCPVQPLKLGESENDARLPLARQGIFRGHTEDGVQDVDFDVRPQRCQRLEMFSQLFLATPGHAGDEQFTALLTISFP